MRIIIYLICLYFFTSITSAQIMVIHFKNGRTVEYQLKDVEKVTYDYPQSPLPKNITSEARIEASSIIAEDYDTRYAVDGSTRTGWLAKCSDGEWIKFKWPKKVTITSVLVINRPKFGGSYDPISKSEIEFEDGTIIYLDPMNSYLSKVETNVPNVQTRWLRFKIIKGNGCRSNGGLAEIEIYGY